MTFERPELLLLILPTLAVYWRLARVRGVTGWLRVVCLALLVTTIAGPKIVRESTGADVIVIVDRSESMPVEGENNPEEIIAAIEDLREEGCSVGVVEFAGAPRMTRMTATEGHYTRPSTRPVTSGSDLAGALEMAVSMIPKDRPARLVVITDGKYTDRSPQAAWRLAAARGIPVDYRYSARPEETDVAVSELSLPRSVDAHEPFQFSGAVWSNASGAFQYKLLRGDRVLGRGQSAMKPGLTHLSFRDILPEPGTHEYRLEIESILTLVTENGKPTLKPTKDSVTLNNAGRAVVRAEGKRGLLVVNATGRVGNFAKALTAGGLEVTVAKPSNANFNQEGLDSYTAVVLENVHAHTLGLPAIRSLSRYVNDLGGGLLVTGGKQSLGVGGYMRSDLEDTLPVSMELRTEHRKASVAIAIVLDRSGSMAVSVGGGRTKMDLANLGSVEALHQLTEHDALAVIAVDSLAHIIQPLTTLSDKKRVAETILHIDSMGGGIFVKTGLIAAGKELERAKQQTRHVLLFSDAGDSEEQEGCDELVASFKRMGITLSVIGLGTERDSDAEFLKRIARDAGGRCLFTASAKELPQLFAQETLAVSRSTFVDEFTPTRRMPDARGFGDTGGGGFPTLGGYNLSYLRPNATAGAITDDEYEAPVTAFWQRGLGRAAVVTAEVDGEFTGPLRTWNGYGGYFSTLCRWLGGEAEPGEYRLVCKREGGTVTAMLELDPAFQAAARLVKPTLLVVPPDGEQPRSIPMNWVGEDQLVATFKAEKQGTYFTVAKIDPGSGGIRTVRGNPVTLPYSPEFAPFDKAEDPKVLLETMAKETGGKARGSLEGVFDVSGQIMASWRMAPALLGVVAVLMLLEIAGRRLSLWHGIDSGAAARAIARAGQRANVWGSARISRKRKRASEARPETPDAVEHVISSTGAGSQGGPEAESKKPSSVNALKAAKDKARKKTDR